ncbi:MAG: hypothetical protein MUC49_22045 [Raineya sp.]|jgi:hypothetical protein|nr:hypothetical protein [Raineya sp.]
MVKIDLYKKYQMYDFFGGGCFEIEFDITHQSLDFLEFLDQICIKEKLHPIFDKWQKIDFQESCDLLLNALNFDLAYQRCENMPFEKALFFQKLIIEKFDQKKCFCFTNWFQNPWKEENGASWNSITNHTFDMAIVFTNFKRHVFIYFISED